MTAVVIDTLQYANKLKNGGVPSQLAEVQAEALSGVLHGMMQETLATKQDTIEIRRDFKEEILEVRHELKQDIAEVRHELKQEISEVRQEVKELAIRTEQGIADAKRDTKELEHRLGAHIDGLETKIVVKMGAMLGGSIAILSTLLVILHIH